MAYIVKKAFCIAVGSRRGWGRKFWSYAEADQESQKSEVADFEAVRPPGAVSPTCRQKAAKSLVKSEAEIYEAVRPPGAVSPTHFAAKSPVIGEASFDLPPLGDVGVGQVPASSVRDKSLGATAMDASVLGSIYSHRCGAS